LVGSVGHDCSMYESEWTYVGRVSIVVRRALELRRIRGVAVDGLGVEGLFVFEKLELRA